MNRLTPVLYIRSTLASSRAVEQTDGSTKETEAGKDGTAASGSGSTVVPPAPAGEDSSRPGAARRRSSFLSALRNVGNPFRSAEPSGGTPSGVDDNPFESVVTENISVGYVPVRLPRLTDPIAPCTGFAMQAEVVKHASRFTELRKAQRKTSPEKASKADESEGGLFFASRRRGRSPQLGPSTEEHFPDNPPPREPLVDYLKVDIPNISIILSGTEGSL
ncbi:hypothetical protein BJV78DRAFT_1351505 [Lactifluus subvellereus]|nr:hypothetical protein BJV78DRAFT_1351505 [Lactifluus subvellereus]